MRIGNVELPNNLILAPMAGVSDLPFRLLCREMGAGLTVMEMVSAKAILYKNKNTISKKWCSGTGQKKEARTCEPARIPFLLNQVDDRPLRTRSSIEKAFSGRS